MTAHRRTTLVGRLAALVAILWLLPTSAMAQPNQNVAQLDNLLMRPLALVLALALVGLLPFVFMALTAFVKISTVLQIAKSAIGAHNVPSNTVILALASALTLLAMAPVGSKIAERITPLFADEQKPSSELIGGLIDGTREPLHDFLRSNASKKETARFLELARQSRPEAERAAVTAADWVVVVPAFMVTELVEAFTLGFAIFLPFIIIDLVVGNVLLALGMQMMNPTQVSLPFKLLLFVAADGWGLLSQALITGYQVT